MQPQNQNPYQQPVQPSTPPTPGPAPVVSSAPPAVQQAPAQQPSGSAPLAPVSLDQPPATTGDAQQDPNATEVVFYGDEEGDDYEDEQIDLSEPVTWQAKEYVHHEKNSTWFIAFGVVMALLMVLAAVFMRSWTFSALLVVIGIVILILAKRPPRVMNYSLSEKGLHIGDTLHSFSDFRAFGVIHDGQEYSIMLIPTKRFLPGITVYFPEESGEEIVDALGSRMPMQELHLDIIDRIVRKLRLG